MFQKLKRELLAGITVSVVALPLALAFGMQATGNSDGAIIGLYGATITGFFAALFGGTKSQVTGPTGPITIIFTGIVATQGLEYAFIAAFLGGKSNDCRCVRSNSLAAAKRPAERTRAEFVSCWQRY
jgi:sulfate permease, SulP family